jgi:myosin heavy subunit
MITIMILIWFILQSVTVPKNVALEPLSWAQLLQPPSDLVMLDVMNLPLILNTLRHRFKQGQIYTNVGDILISINPFRPLPLYTPMVIDQYQHRGSSEMAPHVFIVADDALRGLMSSEMNQSIIISGESGAGKTEATKQCLQYLAESAGSSSHVEQKILMANPILEAFGNAKTVRNNNSSRFGKYIEIFFNARGQIESARNTQYLLEKTRVVHQSAGERNYHVFYQLVRGVAAAANTRSLNLTTQPENYNYLKRSGCNSIDGVDDAQDFKDLLAAMQVMQFSQQGLFFFLVLVLKYLFNLY